MQALNRSGMTNYTYAFQAHISAYHYISHSFRTAKSTSQRGSTPKTEAHPTTSEPLRTGIHAYKESLALKPDRSQPVYASPNQIMKPAWALCVIVPEHAPKGAENVGRRDADVTVS
ncbi:predicted protein [Histoplasma capsulatum G186AR]|uniref:Uncharacterized protein n=1 Tax=Ajellomyces capsulatus (strain G186AR / H82 / ATCC MYA-2454 / RMSCC 2432) TaxID=447093 RepID=C0NLS7_AJECG|nr:uncharacterized protein HCBG_04457 [Histoplasma capsulatum G186AR]EEH07578.1 predicted protein [Histoplasma capsulatum G186AR]